MLVKRDTAELREAKYSSGLQVVICWRMFTNAWGYVGVGGVWPVAFVAFHAVLVTTVDEFSLISLTLSLGTYIQ